MKLNYLKYFEEYLLKPHKNYDERDKYAEEKIYQLLQNKKIYNNLIIDDKFKFKLLYKLEYIEQTLSIVNNKSLKNLNNITDIDGNLIIEISNIESLSKLNYVGYDIKLYNNKYLKDLGDLEKVNMRLIISNNQNLKSLFNIKTIINNLHLDNQLIDFSNLENIYGSLNIYNNATETLNKIQEIGNNLNIDSCKKLKDVGNITIVGNNIIAYNTKNLKSLYPIEKVEGNYIYLYNSSIEDISSLKYFNGTIHINKDNKIPKHQLNKFKVSYEYY